MWHPGSKPVTLPIRSNMHVFVPGGVSPVHSVAPPVEALVPHGPPQSSFARTALMSKRNSARVSWRRASPLQDASPPTARSKRSQAAGSTPTETTERSDLIAGLGVSIASPSRLPPPLSRNMASNASSRLSASTNLAAVCPTATPITGIFYFVDSPGDANTTGTEKRMRLDALTASRVSWLVSLLTPPPKLNTLMAKPAFMPLLL